MFIATHQDEIQVLGQQLQTKLEAIAETPLQVRCLLKQNRLMIFVEHALQPYLNLQIMVEAASDIIQTPLEPMQTLVQEFQTLPIRFFLRMQGQLKPYAAHTWLLQAGTFSTVVLAADRLAVAGEPTVAIAESTDLSLESIPESTEAAVTRSVEAVAHAAMPNSEAGNQLVCVSPEILNPDASNSLKHPAHVLQEDACVLQEDACEDVCEDASDQTWQIFGNRLPIVQLVGLVSIFSALAGCVFVLTRPCMVGGCAPLEAAQHLTQQSMQTLDETTSFQQVSLAYHQLIEANYHLGSISRWSSYYPAAQTLLHAIETDVAVLEQVVEGLEKAYQAALKSQDSPHPIARWREVQALWREAIAALENVPSDSAIYPLTQRKLAEYKNNLTEINQRLTGEQQATVKVAAARSAAQLAETRENLAQSAADWQKVQASWQGVVDAMTQVQRSTMAYAEAQQLLAIYQPKLDAARDRHTQEKISINAYSQAVKLAEQAQSAEQAEQWSQAVNDWQRALSLAQQVPENTLYHRQMQPLLTAYQASLSTAQENLRVAMAIQQAEPELIQTCSGTPQICTYLLNSNTIQVQIAAESAASVEQAMLYQTDYATDVESAVRINSLLRAIAFIGDRSQVPIELLDGNGVRFGVYDPEASGYIRR